uniref:Pyrin domain-containing protein n=1 Tax=Neolamprologus brichardi TaxID=32507 RepID=A0A3Q4G772_NEOBR
MTSKKFKSVPDILKEMTPAQRTELFNAIRAVLPRVTWETAAHLIAAVMGDHDLKRRIINFKGDKELQVSREILRTSR